MRKILTMSSALLAVFAATVADALTFKSDGSVVQNSGKVVLESHAERFNRHFSQSDTNWPLSTGAASTPWALWATSSCRARPCWPYATSHDDYVDALMRTNGFPDKNALQRYFVAMPTPPRTARFDRNSGDCLHKQGEGHGTTCWIWKPWICWGRNMPSPNRF